MQTRHIIRRAAVALTIAAASVPASAAATRTLSDRAARDAAFAQAIKDTKTTTNTLGAHWLAPEINRCSRRSATWVRCTYTIGEIKSGKVGRLCKRTVEVRLRSGRTTPTITRHPLTCTG
jgi:hypothetical protein